jgi:hypothetical protein
VTALVKDNVTYRRRGIKNKVYVWLRHDKYVGLAEQNRAYIPDPSSVLEPGASESRTLMQYNRPNTDRIKNVDMPIRRHNTSAWLIHIRGVKVKGAISAITWVTLRDRNH